MAKKKKEEGIAEENGLQEQLTGNAAEGICSSEDGTQPPEGSEYQEGDSDSGTSPYEGDPGSEASGKNLPGEHQESDEHGDPDTTVPAGDDLYGDEQLPGDHEEELFPGTEDEDSDLFGAYGSIESDDPDDDPYGEGDGPPQFDLPSLASPPEGALLLDTSGPFSEEELQAAAAMLPVGDDSGVPESNDTEPAAAPRPRRTRAARAGNPEPSSAPAPSRRQRTVSSTSNVLSIDDDLKVQSSEDKDALLWMELRGSMRSKRILTGILGGVERSPAGGCIAVVYYKDQRIVIPAEEMFIDIGIHQTESRRDLQNRYAQILTRNLGAEMDFIISGIDRRGNSVVASRKDAMIRKQINYYHPSARRRTPIINEGMIVEARVISVGTKNIRVEVFGAESTIWARYVAWEWVEDCTDYFQVGGRVLVKVMSIDRTNPERLGIAVSIRDCFENPAQENIEKCHTQGKYIGKVTGMDTRAIYVRLNVGVNGIATACHDRKVPGRKDDVSFVVTKLDKEQGVAIGIITKIIKQHF